MWTAISQRRGNACWRLPERLVPDEIFDEYLARWKLVRDGEPCATHSSCLLPVRQQGVPAMLKIAFEAEERWGSFLMVWWQGEGAAGVLGYDENALLLERACGERSLAEMARSGQDDEASRIICAVAARLHLPRDRPPPELIPLSLWFRQLWPAADRHGGIIAKAAEITRDLLATERDAVVLHGDLHHGNVLDGGPRGWLAIDPKRLVGERGFDYANILRNPDDKAALSPGRFSRQVDVIAEAAGLDRSRLVHWVLAFAGLSAAWIHDDGDWPELDLAIAELALTELAKG